MTQVHDQIHLENIAVLLRYTYSDMMSMGHRPASTWVAFEEPIEIRQFPTRRALHLACKIMLPRSLASIHPPKIPSSHYCGSALEAGAFPSSRPPTYHSIKQRKVRQNAAGRAWDQLHFLPIFAKQTPLAMGIASRRSDTRRHDQRPNPSIL